MAAARVWLITSHDNGPRYHMNGLSSTGLHNCALQLPQLRLYAALCEQAQATVDDHGPMSRHCCFLSVEFNESWIIPAQTTDRVEDTQSPPLGALMHAMRLSLLH